MGRFDINGTAPVSIDIPRLGGLNTAESFSEIDVTQSPSILNALPKKIGGLAKREGTVPLTTTALGAAIKVLCNLRKNGVNSILATSGTTLYKYGSGAWTAQTMTNALTSDAIDYAQFKDANSAEVLVIADGGSLKYYDGAAVANIPPAADDASPAPANDLTNINTNHPPIGCVIHNTRVVIWDGSDTIWHSKIGYYDYFPNTNFQRYVRENDYVVTCITFSGALLVFMRRHIGALFGDGYSSTPTAGDWSQDFLDTTDGCINAKTVQTVVYPDGREEVFYLSDHGVHAVYTIDTLALDTSARYSTKSMTKGLVDWEALGVSDADWANAVGHYRDGRYWLMYPNNGAWQGLVFDTIDGQWYPIDGISVNSLYHDEDYFYFAGDDGHLKVFDATLYSDYADAAKTTKTPINLYWYSKLVTPGVTGFAHLWDDILIEAKQHNVDSTVDVEVNLDYAQLSAPSALKTTIFIVGVTPIGTGQIANPNLTDIVNNAKLLPVRLRGKYAQVKLSNDRDEPVEIFNLKLLVRPMTQY